MNPFANKYHLPQNTPTRKKQLISCKRFYFSKATPKTLCKQHTYFTELPTSTIKNSQLSLCFCKKQIAPDSTKTLKCQVFHTIPGIRSPARMDSIDTLGLENTRRFKISMGGKSMLRSTNMARVYK